MSAAGRAVRMLVAHRLLLARLVARDLASRYRGSAVGLLWAVLHPLAFLLLYTFVFSWVLEVRLGPDVGTPHFPLFLLAGLLPWQAIQEALGRATGVILGQPSLVKRTPFPTEILPATVVLSALAAQLVGTALLVVLLAGFGQPPRPALLLFPVLLGLQVVLTLGLGWALASLNVYLRDVGHLLGIGLTLWMFLTPVFYPPTLFPRPARFLLVINPLAVLVESYRAILLRGVWPAPAPLLALGLLAAGLFAGGFWLFRRLQPGFADAI
jgi:ABC-type polysaccharide/polyol phosphate export permease